MIIQDWDGGIVRVRDARGKIHRVLVREDTGLLKVGDGLQSSGFGLNLADELGRINHGE